jgi:hypothetical protein
VRHKPLIYDKTNIDVLCTGFYNWKVETLSMVDIRGIRHFIVIAAFYQFFNLTCLRPRKHALSLQMTHWKHINWKPTNLKHTHLYQVSLKCPWKKKNRQNLLMENFLFFFQCEFDILNIMMKYKITITKYVTI